MNILDFGGVFVPPGPECRSVVAGAAEDPPSRFKQEKARKEQQHRHNVKSDEYLETVVKPRQEAVLRKKEKDFYHMTGQSWQLSQGFTLGGLMMQEEGAMAGGDDDDIPNRTAARKRKELEAPNPVLVQTHLPKEKKIISLPEEPLEDADGILLDWMHKSGYSPTLYALYTSYPRRPLLTRTDVSMEEVGINTHTVLNVEEKDPSTS
ncbi:UBX domain-containing protein 8 [Bagarius yarrelli]|uniref:UBX domain-containing protein 8 n=1 Tax=Bagarius yarrelli TaxID=175774 RepID=A0A556V271_BAGYA|nr:UBX domain-containing protein 8 [Bagarius yarrelli]